MQVLEAGEVAARDDQVHPLLVFDVEVADGLAARVDDAEPQLLASAAFELGVGEFELEPVVGDREAAHGVGLGRGAVSAALVSVAARSLLVVGHVVAAVGFGVDELAGDEADGVEAREDGREGRELPRDRIHPLTS